MRKKVSKYVIKKSKALHNKIRATLMWSCEKLKSNKTYFSFTQLRIKTMKVKKGLKTTNSTKKITMHKI